MLPLRVFSSSFLLGGDQFILLNAGFDGGNEMLRRARFREKPENGAFVDGIDGRLLVRIAGEHHANAFRGGLTDSLQKGDTVHDGHSHVRYDDGKGSLGGNFFSGPLHR